MKKGSSGEVYRTADLCMGIGQNAVPFMSSDLLFSHYVLSHYRPLPGMFAPSQKNLEPDLAVKKSIKCTCSQGEGKNMSGQHMYGMVGSDDI